MFLLFATIITLAAAAPNGIVDPASINNNNFEGTINHTICKTSTCESTAAFILKNMNSRVNPCDNFYHFACGKYVEESIIPDDETIIDIFREIYAESKEQVLAFISDGIKEDDSSVFKVVKTYYETCMNTEQNEENSVKDLREILEKMCGCPILDGEGWNETTYDWKKSVYEINNMGYHNDIFVNVMIRIDPKNNKKRIITIDQTPTMIFLEYLKGGKDEVREYVSLFSNIIEFFGIDKNQAENMADSLVNFEIELAKISLSYDERRDATKLNNCMNLQELETNYQGIPWTEYINRIFGPHVSVNRSEEIIVVVPSFFKQLPALIARTPKHVLANYACFRIIHESLPNMEKGLFKFTWSNGKEPERRKVCFDSLSNYFSIALSRLYVKHYADKNAKTKVADLVANIRNNTGHMIEKADWLSNTTKLAALEKLYSMASTIGYPDELDNDEKIDQYFQNLTLHPESFLKSELSLKRFRKKINVSNLRKTVNRTDWITSGDVTVPNGVYNSLLNSLQLKAGILQGHFYNNDRPNYMNYGAIGPIIGHEISHSFDDHGSQYDKIGNLVNWWEEKTREKYLEKVSCFIEQYGNYTAQEVNMKINGINTQSENIADNVGLKAAYLAYNGWTKRNGKEPQLPGLNYTPQQMFWISFANTNCEKIRPEALKENIVKDVHAPGEVRVIGSVSNMPEFSKDFMCPVGSLMNPANKCSIW